jgi:hypothetical protein
MKIVPKPDLKPHIKQPWKASLSQIGFRYEVVPWVAVTEIGLQPQSGMFYQETPLAAKAAILTRMNTTGLGQTLSILLALKTSLGLLEAMFTNGLRQIRSVRLE